MPGAGKTYWLRPFAEALHLPPIDMDASLVDKYKESIPEMMSRGEVGFRERESALLQELLSRPEGAVIATGGGTPCYQDNLPAMKAAGIVLYLSCSVPCLQKRLTTSAVERPLLKTTAGQGLDAALKETFRARRAVYEQADLTFDTERDDFKEIVRQIHFINQENGKRNV